MTNICEYCGVNQAVFSIELTTPEGKIEESDLVCPKCVSTWFTETPEDVERMSIVRLEEERAKTIENLEAKLKKHWEDTAEERKRTHTSVLHEKYMKRMEVKK